MLRVGQIHRAPHQNSGWRTATANILPIENGQHLTVDPILEIPSADPQLAGGRGLQIIGHAQAKSSDRLRPCDQWHGRSAGANGALHLLRQTCLVSQ